MIMCGNKDKHLEGSLTLCSVSKIVAVCSPLVTRRSTAIGSWLDLQYQAHVSSWGSWYKINPEIYQSHNIYATLHSWEYLPRPVISVASRVPELCKTPAACIAPSLNMKVSWQEGNFQVRVILISSCIVIKLWSTYSYRVSPSNFGGQTRAMIVPCIGFGVVLSIQTTQREEPHTWHWTFLVCKQWLLGRALSLMQGDFPYDFL